MKIAPRDITIAITVYNRRDYICQAIRSALNQTVPVRVIVVEDCGPDGTLRDLVLNEFGGQIEYFRNQTNRGLFDNWNACIEYCQTPWLSICHDDDYLSPGFVEAIIALSDEAHDCGLYLGCSQVVDERGKPIIEHGKPFYVRKAMPPHVRWDRVELEDCIFDGPPVAFAGQLFRVNDARTLGGFQKGSQFAGDWEMWCRLIAFRGAAQWNEVLAFCRWHGGEERGCTKIDRNGRHRSLVFVQQKRVLRMIRDQGREASFDREKFLDLMPMSATSLLRYGAGFSGRVLRYNVGLLLRSRSPSFTHKLFQMAARLFGWRGVRFISTLYSKVCKSFETSGPG
jgi:glycosyltransferase involved in cell wall biosynthesis